MAANIPELPQELLDDFEAKNKESYELDAKRFGSNCVLLSEQELHDMLFDEGPAALYEYEGVVAFSRVDFNDEKTQALVYVYQRAYGASGPSGGYTFLAKEGREWVIQQTVLLWIS
ncbi:MAG: hypothetical protein AB8I69_22365 [Anaerolineae bacterium]